MIGRAATTTFVIAQPASAARFSFPGRIGLRCQSIDRAIDHRAQLPGIHTAFPPPPFILPAALRLPLARAVLPRPFLLSPARCSISPRVPAGWVFVISRRFSVIVREPFSGLRRRRRRRVTPHRHSRRPRQLVVLNQMIPHIPHRPQQNRRCHAAGNLQHHRIRQ
jgi:hypothetical protein